MKLYMDDLERIVAALQEFSDEISIETDEYSLTELGELEELREENITHLDLGARRWPSDSALPSSVSVNLRPDTAFVFASQDDPASRGTFENVKKFLESRKQPLWWLIHTVDWWGGLVLGVCVVLIALAWRAGFAWPSIAALIGLAISLGCIAFFIRHRLAKNTIIVLAYRRDAPSFWKKNRDAIIARAIPTVLGVLLGFLLGRCTK